LRGQEVDVPISVITWVHVPPGSQLEVNVGPNDEARVSGGDLFMDDKGLIPVKQWSDAELSPGPAVEQLKAGVDYTVDIRAASASLAVVEGVVTAVLRQQATGTVIAREERPFRLEPRSHHLVRIFVDADPLPVLPESEASLPPAPAARAAGRTTARRKRGK
jgi:hypothetical protein